MKTILAYTLITLSVLLAIIQFGRIIPLSFSHSHFRIKARSYIIISQIIMQLCLFGGLRLLQNGNPLKNLGKIIFILFSIGSLCIALLFFLNAQYTDAGIYFFQFLTATLFAFYCVPLTPKIKNKTGLTLRILSVFLFIFATYFCTKTEIYIHRSLTAFEITLMTILFGLVISLMIISQKLNPITARLNRKLYGSMLVFFSVTLIAYSSFVATDLFVPKQEEIVNPKGLFKEVLREITKIETKSDTIIFIYARPFLDCGNEDDGMSSYDRKIKEIKYNKEHPYFIDFVKSYDEVNKINNKTIIVGSPSEIYPTGFIKLNSNQVDLEINLDRFNCYKPKYKIINQNKVEVSVSLNDFGLYHFSEPDYILKLILTESNGEWVSKRIKI